MGDLFDRKGDGVKGGSYTVLARRYRSRDFDEIVGQEPIARTLRNAVATGRTGHAYLFCGTRGVGKTSMARILARAINVTPELSEADAISAAIFRGEDLDVVEIDGASNRGVQEARDLIAGAGLSPARCPFKIYIIDEVHMLTKPAFNTLLKTMEEPPRHVKFILCTTEPEDVPATIQSRCQRFDFRSLSSAEIAGQLGRILEAEGIAAEPEVIQQVARMGRGSMRDSLSLLDRLLASGESPLTLGVLDRMLGLPDRALVAAVIDAVAAGDPTRGLEAGAELLSRGASVDRALELIIEHLRDLLLAVTCGAESDLVELSGEARAAAAKQARGFDAAGLVYLMALCDAVARNARNSAVARALYDAAIVRMCQSEKLADVAQLLAAPPAPGIAVAEPKKKEPLIPPAAERPETPEPDAADAGAIWDRVLAHAERTPADLARIEGLRYRSFDGQTLKLGIVGNDPGLARWLSGQTAALVELVRQATGRRVAVELDTADLERRRAASSSARIEKAQGDPLVKTAMKIFDAAVIDVQDHQERPSDV